MVGPPALASPAAHVPPLETVVAPLIVPEPANVALLATVTILVPSEPSTCNVPALTVVVPELAQAPLMAMRPDPLLVKLPVSLAGPLASKSTVPVPRATLKAPA